MTNGSGTNCEGEGGKVEGEIVEGNMVLGHKYTMRKSRLGGRPMLSEKIVGQIVQGPKAESNIFFILHMFIPF